jgi:hypothetical protein
MIPRVIAIVAFAVVTSSHRAGAVTWELPDATHTPGAIGARDGVRDDAATVCRRGFARAARHPYDAEWRRYVSAVYREYGIPAAARSRYRIDHLVPIEIDGRPFGIIRPLFAAPIWDLRNVWAEPKAEAAEKDEVENALHAAVCYRRGYHGIHLTLDQAQRAIARDWTTSPVGLPALHAASHRLETSD